MASHNAAPSTSNDFVIAREFDAPRDLVWKAHTELDRMKQWWGPKGFEWVTGSLDLRPGGLLHYGLKTPNGQEMWGRLLYREIVAPERLVFIVSFSDAKGGIARHPMSPTWPLEMFSTSTFSERNGKTTVTIRWHPHNATDEELATFEAGRDGMRAGFGGTFDQLDEYLATRC